MYQTMVLESLLVTRDPEVLRVLRLALGKLGIAVEVCTGTEAGGEIIDAKKFDAVIIDCDDLNGGLDILQGVRKGTTNKSAVTFAILNGHSSIRTAFGMGASFVLQKPITMAAALRCFSAAEGAMLRERRRYFRVPVEAPVTIHYGQGGEMRVTAYNLSEGGMAIHAASPLPATAISTVNFTLPGTRMVLEPKSELAWSDGAGKAGIRFRDLPKSTREELERWVAQKLEVIDAARAAKPQVASAT
jgi:ActR/RegA family two-component response regulator